MSSPCPRWYYSSIALVGVPEDPDPIPWALFVLHAMTNLISRIGPNMHAAFETMIWFSLGCLLTFGVELSCNRRAHYINISLGLCQLCARQEPQAAMLAIFCPPTCRIPLIQILSLKLWLRPPRHYRSHDIWSQTITEKPTTNLQCYLQATDTQHSMSQGMQAKSK